MSFGEAANRRPAFESTALLLVESRCSCGRTEDDDMLVGQLLANGVTAFYNAAIETNGNNVVKK